MGQGYLHNYLVADYGDIDYLASQLSERSDEGAQRDIIEILSRNPERLKGKREVVKLARSKADAMSGTFVNRVFFGNSLVEETNEKVRAMEIQLGSE